MPDGLAPPALRAEPTKIALTRERLRLVVFAEYGIGKTTLAMSFPKPLVINTDDGLISVTTQRHTEDLGLEWTPGGHKDLEGLAWWIKDHSSSADSIVIDDGGELVFLLLNELVDRGADYDRKKGKDTHPVAEFIPEQAEYLANQRQMHAFLTELKKLNKHVVLTAGVRNPEPPKTTRRGPDFAPGLAKVVMKWASIAGELIALPEDDDARKLKAGTRILLTNPASPAREGKTRFPELNPMVVEPSFAKLWAPVSALYKKAGVPAEGTK